MGVWVVAEEECWNLAPLIALMAGRDGGIRRFMGVRKPRRRRRKVEKVIIVGCGMVMLPPPLLVPFFVFELNFLPLALGTFFPLPFLVGYFCL